MSIPDKGFPLGGAARSRLDFVERLRQEEGRGDAFPLFEVRGEGREEMPEGECLLWGKRFVLLFASSRVIIPQSAHQNSYSTAKFVPRLRCAHGLRVSLFGPRLTGDLTRILAGVRSGGLRVQRLDEAPCMAALDSKGRKRCPHGVRRLPDGSREMCPHPVDC